MANQGMKLLRDHTEPELTDLLNSVARAVAGLLPAETGFLVLVFDDPGLAQFISNLRRPVAIAALREAADRLELRQDTPHGPALLLGPGGEYRHSGDEEAGLL